MRALMLWQSALFALMVLAVAAVAGLRVQPVQAPTADEWVDGRLARAFESHYDAVFPGRTLGTNLWAAIELVVFREGKPGVVIGQQGWLYTDEEFRTYAGAEQALAAHLSLIPYVRDRLAASGTQLVVALLPAKARVYSEFTGSREPASIHHELYARARAAILAAGIDAPDLQHALTQCKRRGPVFLRTDTHWTPEGARCAADALSGGLRRAGPERYRTVVDRVDRAHGDLVKFLPLEPYFPSLVPPMESVAVRRTEPVAGASDDAALLGDLPDPEIVLVGTSYSADSRWNLAGALQDGFQEDVVNFAAAGQGPFAPMLEYLHRQPERLGLRAPRLLVWEIPERYLVQPRDLRVDSAAAPVCPAPAAPLPTSVVNPRKLLQTPRAA